MPIMVGLFAVMNALFISAIAVGTSANAILLQNTAPFFVYLVTVYLLGEPADRRSLYALLIGMAGMIVILAGGGEFGGSFEVMLMGLGSGVTYAGIILCLRYLRNESSQWLIVQNHLGSAVCLSVAVLILNGATFRVDWMTAPTLRQLAFRRFSVQFRWACRTFCSPVACVSVNPQEAGALTLIEPLLNPLWAFLISPETDTPAQSTWIGGSMIVGALAYRYLPRSRTGFQPVPSSRVRLET